MKRTGQKRFGIARKLFVVFTVVAIIPIAAALLVSVSVLIQQAGIVSDEVLWGKIKLAKFYYDGRRDGIGRALETASRNNAILVNIALSLDSPLTGILADMNKTQNLDCSWVLNLDGSRFASSDWTFPFYGSSGSFPSGKDSVFKLIELPGGVGFLEGTRCLISGNGTIVGYVKSVINLRSLCADASASIKTPVFILLDSGSSLYSPEILNAGSLDLTVSNAGTKKSTQLMGTIAGKPYLINIESIGENEFSTALIGVAYPQSLLNEPRNRGILMILIAGFFAVLLALFGGNYFRKKIIGPVLSVAEAARIIADGVVGHTVGFDTPDEVGDLARDFNRMSERLFTQGKEREKAERLIEESLREKETLLKEIHHRVKNNFQIINSLFDLQLMDSNSPVVEEILKEPKARIHAMALIHDRLYLSENFSAIDFSEYLMELAQDLFYGYNVDPSRIVLDIDAEPVYLDMDRSIPCGLILNEIMTNSLKYAFPESIKKGKITVTLKRRDNSIILGLEDNGVGFTPDTGTRTTGTLGLTLVRILTEQIKGSYSIVNDHGVKVIITFPA